MLIRAIRGSPSFFVPLRDPSWTILFMPKLKILKQTPASLGYRFPAEWEPHAARGSVGRGRRGSRFRINITRFRRIWRGFLRRSPRASGWRSMCPTGIMSGLFSSQLDEHGCPLKNIFFHHIKTNESWCRDHGPAFVVNGKGKAAIVDWGFNAWGGKYPPYDDDDAVPTRMAEELGLPVFYPGQIGPWVRLQKRSMGGPPMLLSSWRAGASNLTGPGRC